MPHQHKVRRRLPGTRHPKPGGGARTLAITPVQSGLPQVYLRPLTASDEEELLAITNESRGFHSPWLSPPTTAPAFAAYLQRTMQADFEARLVCHDDGRILGALNLSQIVRGNFRSAYLGYWVGVRYAHQGYMTRAMHLLLAFAFRELNLHRIEANIQPGNASSIKLVERCGFRLEGFSPRYLKIRNRWRDHQRWAMLHEEWRGNESAIANKARMPAK